MSEIIRQITIYITTTKSPQLPSPHFVDYSLRLQYALDHITLEKARLLWDFLLEHRHLVKGVVETSNYQNFVDAQREEKLSKIGQLCSQQAWLPDTERIFYIPKTLFLTDLPKGFENDTLQAQEIALKLGMKKPEELQLADKLGIPHELISLIQDDPEIILVWYHEQRQNKPSLPSSITSDPERRKEKAATAAYATEEKAYKTVTINSLSIVFMDNSIEG